MIYILIVTFFILTAYPLFSSGLKKAMRLSEKNIAVHLKLNSTLNKAASVRRVNLF